MFFKDLWYSFRRSPFFMLLTVVELVALSVSIYITAANCFFMEEQNNASQIKWGDNCYYMLNLNAGRNIHLAVTFSSLSLGDPDENERLERIEVFEKIDSFYNDIKESGLITAIVCEEQSNLQIFEPKQWNSEDIVTGAYGLFQSIDEEYGSYVYHPLYVGEDYLSFFDVKLSEGEYFKAEDYYYDGDVIPVIMGADFKKYYELGEEFSAQLSNCKKTVMKVIGFAAENQYFTTPALNSRYFTYDNYILVPYCERPIGDFLIDYSGFMGQFSLRAYYSFFISPETQSEETYDKISTLLEKNGLSEYFAVRKITLQKELSDNISQEFGLSLAVSVIMAFFVLFSMIFVMLYRTDEKMKDNAVRIMVGQTHSGIILQSIVESFILFLAASIAGFFIFGIYAVGSYIFQGYDYLASRTILAGIAVSAAFFVVSSLAAAVCIKIKLKSYSISLLIRGRSVQTRHGMSLYKVMIVLMFAGISVFSMGISGYYVQKSRLDLYYKGYHTDNTTIVYLAPMTSDTSKFKNFDYTSLGKNIMINRYISMGYVGAAQEDYLVVRGLYFNGNVPSIDLLSGRFFTETEVSSDEKIAVVGKGILEKYTESDGDNRVYIYGRNNDRYTVIGILGKENEQTSLDYTVFIPIYSSADSATLTGSATVDGYDKNDVSGAVAALQTEMSEYAGVTVKDYTANLSVNGPVDQLMLMLTEIIINAVILCSCYIDKKRYVFSVKTLIGYSKSMIFLDTFVDFLLLTAISFLGGNVLMTLLSSTVLSGVGVFSLYIPDPVAFAAAFSGTVLLALVFSIIAINRTFIGDRARSLR